MKELKKSQKHMNNEIKKSQEHMKETKKSQKHMPNIIKKPQEHMNNEETKKAKKRIKKWKKNKVIIMVESQAEQTGYRSEQVRAETET